MRCERSATVDERRAESLALTQARREDLIELEKRRRIFDRPRRESRCELAVRVLCARGVS